MQNSKRFNENQVIKRHKTFFKLANQYIHPDGCSVNNNNNNMPKAVYSSMGIGSAQNPIYQKKNLNNICNFKLDPKHYKTNSNNDSTSMRILKTYYDIGLKKSLIGGNDKIAQSTYKAIINRNMNNFGNYSNKKPVFEAKL